MISPTTDPTRTEAVRRSGRIAIYYEHPRWFEPLFAELDRREAAYIRLSADSRYYDPANLAAERGIGLVFNRMSPSAYRRGNGHDIYFTLGWLAHLQMQGVRVVNGERAFRHEISKALQLSLLRFLGLPFPHAHVFHRAEDAPGAATGLHFPVVVKPNVGGSGAGVMRFETPDALAEATREGRLDLGLDGVGLVQEFIPAQGGYITRVEVLGGKFLYAIRVYLSGETFDLCPADICRTTGGTELDTACPVEAPKAGLRVEAVQPPQEVIDQVERIMEAAGIEVGGIEYLVDDRDGQLYYYDVNALSNFVADGVRVIGFDPFVKLADYLEDQAKHG